MKYAPVEILPLQPPVSFTSTYKVFSKRKSGPLWAKQSAINSELLGTCVPAGVQTGPEWESGVFLSLLLVYAIDVM